MKKRILCMLLALVMVLGMIPVTAMRASAASSAISEKGITILKGLSPYQKSCYRNGNRFYIGYGTLCEHKDHNKVSATVPKHTITEVDADKALRTALKDINSSVSSFASKNGLSLNQGQFDALVAYSFLYGSAWMNGTGVFKTAITTKGNSNNKILNAFAQVGWGKQLANMYLHGSYNTTTPSYFQSLKFNGNGGYLAGVNECTYWYDTTVEDYDLPTPTKTGATFKGWYTKAADGERVVVIDRFTTPNNVGGTLYAGWQSSSSGTSVKYQVYTNRISPWVVYSNDRATDIKDTSLLHDSKGNVKSTISVDMDWMDKDGYLWVRIAGTSNWVRLTKSGASSDSPLIDVTVTVTNSYVNIRSKGSIYSTKVGTFKKGDQLRITATKDSSEQILWGQVAKSADDNTPVGWVALSYTNWNAVKAGSGSIKTDVPANALAKAVIQCNSYVNVRSGPGTSNKFVGALANGDWVYIYEFKTVGGVQWGRTDAGWFSLNYAQVTMLKDNTVISTDPSIVSYAFSAKMSVAADGLTNADKKSSSNGSKFKASEAVTVLKLGWNKEASGTWAEPGYYYVRSNSSGKEGWVASSALDLTNAGVSKFVVKNEITTLREDSGESAKLQDKISVGTELQIDNTTLRLANNEDRVTLWGKDTKYKGYVNLSAQMDRQDPLDVHDDKTKPASYEIGTVKGTDRVNVREKASLYCRVVGKLSRGTEVRILAWSDNGKWAKVDTDLENTGKDNWISKDYLDVRVGVLDKDLPADNGGSNSSGTSKNPGGTGIVANTYSGVNVRATPGTSGKLLGKIVPGTAVTIDEIKTVGSSKWGHTEKGWVCMDYIAMMSYDEIPGSTLPEGSTVVGSYDDVKTSVTTAVFSGEVTVNGVKVYKTPDVDPDLESSEEIATLNSGDAVTIHELLTTTVTRTGTNTNPTGPDDDLGEADNTDEEYTRTYTTYWARVNNGYIHAPYDCIKLYPLHNDPYTYVSKDKTSVEIQSSVTGKTGSFELRQGDKVTVSSLKLEAKNELSGKAENEDGDAGWVKMSLLAEGSIYVQESTAATQPTNPGMGNTGNTGDGGFVTNSGGYKYTGKVIRTDALKVRNSPSTTAPVNTTLANGKALVIYETTVADSRAWGRCDAGWVYLYYVDMTPCDGSAIDARVVYNDNTVIYDSSDCTNAVGTYAKMSVIDIYEVVGKMARTDSGWVNTDNLL